MTTAYESLNNMEELLLRAGSDKILTFVCYQENGIDLLTVAGGSAEWRLCPYGEFDVNTLTIAGSFTDANTFTVTITAALTALLSGKFTQQVIITDFSGSTFVPGQGIVFIFPKILD